MTELTGIRDQAKAHAERVTSAVERLAPSITTEALNTFASAARRQLQDRTYGHRRDHLCALTQPVEVISKTEARIIGSRTELLRTLTSSSGVEAAAVGVLGFKPKWRPRKDPNEERARRGVSLTRRRLVSSRPSDQGALTPTGRVGEGHSADHDKSTIGGLAQVSFQRS
jgi:hypothetical protein